MRRGRQHDVRRALHVVMPVAEQIVGRAHAAEGLRTAGGGGGGGEGLGFEVESLNFRF